MSKQPALLTIMYPYFSPGKVPAASNIVVYDDKFFGERYRTIIFCVVDMIAGRIQVTI